MKSDGTIKVFLIKDGEVKAIAMKPSHEDMEHEISTAFWARSRFSDKGMRGVIFHIEGSHMGRSDFTFRGVGFRGPALIARYSEYGDLETPEFSLEDIQGMVKFQEG